MTTKTKTLTEGDLVIHRESAEYCYLSSVLTNPDPSNALTDFDPVGQPVKLSGSDWVFVAASDLSNSGGIVVGPTGKVASIAAGGDTTEKYRILVRGPAVVNQTKIPALDYAGASITAATLATRLEALVPRIDCIVEPTKTETGVT